MSSRLFKTMCKSEAIKNQDKLLSVVREYVEEGWSFPCAVAKAGINYYSAVYISEKFEGWGEVRRLAIKNHKRKSFQ